MKKEIKNSLKELGFSLNEIKVYMALTQLGEATAVKVAKKSDLPRTTVISILERLEELHYLSTHKYRGKTFYWIESPKVIQESLQNKLEIAEQLDGLLTDLYRSEHYFPFAKVYDTKTSIKNFIEKTLISLDKKDVIHTIDTPGAGDYTKIFSDDFIAIMVNLKKKKGIATKTLIPHNAFETIEKEKIKTQDITIKELPKEISFKASLWIINDMLVLFSGNYPFIAAIKHKLITDSIKSIYDYLWNVSEIKKE